MDNTVCSNCGRPINHKTLICEYCGTDYNEYDPVPECEHVYNRVFVTRNIKDLTCDLIFQCKHCGEEVTLKCEDYMISNMFNSGMRL